MANLYNNPVYTTVDDVRDTTDYADLAALAVSDPDAVDKLITQAQTAIDNYIISFGCRCDESQEFIFPTGEDGTCDAIPHEIQKATIKVVEYLFVK